MPQINPAVAPPPRQHVDSQASLQRVEFTPAYKAEFDRLLAIAEKAERAFKHAQAEYDRAHVALVKHIESRHYARAIA